jgi:hypothetical protein
MNCLSVLLGDTPNAFISRQATRHRASQGQGRHNTGIHKDDFAGSRVRLRVPPVLATTFPKDRVHLLPIQRSL